MAEKNVKIGEREFQYSLPGNSAIEQFVIKVDNETSHQRSYYFFTKTEDWSLTVDAIDCVIFTIYGTTDNGEVLNKDFYQKESSGEINKLCIKPYQPSANLVTIQCEVKERVTAPNVSYPEFELQHRYFNKYYVLIVKHEYTTFIQLLKSCNKEIKDCTVQLQSRAKYYFRLYQVDKQDKQNILTGRMYSEDELITRNCQRDVELLKEKAASFISRHIYKVIHLYRNKPSNHSTIIESKETGIMKKYLKDNNGDPFSSINGNISGLHFAATPASREGDLPKGSNFGDYRIKIVPEDLVDGCNLYFADFFCMHGPHWVTLVLTKHGSEEDEFCQNRLVKLDIENNPFFYKSGWSGYEVTSLAVEILYTEDINLKEMRLKRGFEEETILFGGSGSKPNGVPKNDLCSICNLPSN